LPDAARAGSVRRHLADFGGAIDLQHRQRAAGLDLGEQAAAPLVAAAGKVDRDFGVAHRRRSDLGPLVHGSDQVAIGEVAMVEMDVADRPLGVAVHDDNIGDGCGVARRLQPAVAVAGGARLALGAAVAVYLPVPLAAALAGRADRIEIAAARLDRNALERARMMRAVAMDDVVHEASP
jgi:hypothetical protein